MRDDSSSASTPANYRNLHSKDTPLTTPLNPRLRPSSISETNMSCMSC